ncbi:hypothetical protein ZWY2020_022756 [Hordeum vulgare]|nr:hypothetical protein ZWY2020_022756 [Hordeum vulgare]
MLSSHAWRLQRRHTSPSSPPGASSPPALAALHALAGKLFPRHLLLCTCLAWFYLASRLPHHTLQLFGSMPVRKAMHLR